MRGFGYGTDIMSQRETNVVEIETRPPRRDKSTQRERLIAGMIAAACREGYSGLTVSAVISHAGVSRPTFYDYFTDKDDCFLAAHRDISNRLVKHIKVAVEQAPPEQAPQVAIRRLLERAEEEPARAQFIANEAMAGGPRALDARDHTISEIERIIETARADLPPTTPTPDLPTRAIIGAAHWLLSQRMRRGEHSFIHLANELESWIESYNRAAGEARWRTLTPETAPELSPYVSELPDRPPPPIPSGRTRLSSGEITRNQRWRLLFATAETAARKGYTATTVTDITALARVDKRVFYSHFRDKQQAFLATHEVAFQQSMAIAARGFFSADTWPERVWRGIHAASQFIATHPIAYLVHVESHAVGAPAIQRVDDSHSAFMIFLQDGNQHSAQPQSRTAMEAIIAAVFEVGYQQYRHREDPRRLPRFAFHATYLCLAPFLGPQAAETLVDSKRAG
jgi:AcrR family transcriptional regulator